MPSATSGKGVLLGRKPRDKSYQVGSTQASPLPQDRSGPKWCRTQFVLRLQLMPPTTRPARQPALYTYQWIMRWTNVLGGNLKSLMTQSRVMQQTRRVPAHNT
jgi:hypothetical protein